MSRNFSSEEGRGGYQQLPPSDTPRNQSTHSRSTQSFTLLDETNNKTVMQKVLVVGISVLLITILGTIVVVVSNGGAAPASVDHNSENDANDGITFEDYITGRFNAKYFNGSWWSENELQWKDQDGNLVAWNTETFATSVIVSQNMLSSISKGARFMGFSPDNSMILFAYDIENVWRHSFTAKYLVLDTSTNKTVEITNNRLQYCAWVENDDNANNLIYVFENNIYWRKSAVDENTITITNDGVIDNIFNGIPDWVYEEEVLSTNYAHYISPSGKTIAFAQFNDTNVPEFKYPNYGDSMDVLSAQYPTYKTVRYPKSGKTNPTTQMFVTELETANLKKVIPPEGVQTWTEHILTDVTWITERNLSIIWMNRIQNECVIAYCHEEDDQWSCVDEFEIKEASGWLEPGFPIFYDQEGRWALMTLPQKQSDNLTYPHITQVRLAQKGAKSIITAGRMVVTEILSWEEDEQLIYFMGTKEDMPGTRHLYRVDAQGEQNLTCLTCTVQTLDGKACEYNDVEINSESTMYVHTCLGPEIPEVYLRNLTDGTIIFTLEDNAALKNNLQGKQLPVTEYKNIMVDNEKQLMAPVRMTYSGSLAEGSKHPLLVEVYGGPGSQKVDYRWKVDWREYLTTTQNFIHVSIDGRGTGYQSNEYRFAVYRNMGTLEMTDQIEVTRQLVAQNSFISPDQVAIWGWSYGGFATAMTLEADIGENPVFSCGISVAPVTSWLLYDSIYTERYMGLPEDNMDGYNNSVINGIENLRNKRWMLNHGVADDNVHYQHTMLLTRAMERADIQFDQHSYPDENHSLTHVRRFLYHAMNDFLSDCFATRDKGNPETPNNANQAGGFSLIHAGFVLVNAVVGRMLH